MSKNSMLQGAFILMVSSILVRLLGFIYRILLSRSIGPEGMGVLQLITPILFTSLSLVSAGIPLAVSRLVAQRKATKDFRGMGRVLLTALGLVISISLLICMVLILNINWITYNILREPRTRGALFVLYPIIIMISISAVFKGYFYGIKDFYPPAYSEIIEEVIRIVLVFYLLSKVDHLDISIQVATVVLAMVLGEMSSLLYLNYCYHKSRRAHPSSGRAGSPYPLVEILKISAPITLVRLISSLSTSAGSILIPQRLVKSGIAHGHAMGLFGIMSGMVIPLLFLPFMFTGSLVIVMIPNLSEDLTRKNWDGIRSKISKAIFITTTTALPFGAIMASLADPIGILLYNQKEVGSMLELLAYFSGITALSHTLSGILNGLGKQNKSAIFLFIGEAIEIMCIFFLVALPNLRIYGYIIGLLLSNLIVLVLEFITVYKVTNLYIKWGEWFLKPILASLLMGSIARLLYLWLLDSGYTILISFSTSAFVGILIYLFALYIMGSISFAKESIFP